MPNAVDFLVFLFPRNEDVKNAWEGQHNHMMSFDLP